jgi:hypothetical protein
MIFDAALAIAAISTTICKSSLFRHLQKYKLFRCPYCLNHWLAFAYVGHEAFKYSMSPLDFVIKSFLLVTCSSICGYILALYLKEIDRA